MKNNLLFSFCKFLIVFIPPEKNSKEFVIIFDEKDFIFLRNIFYVVATESTVSFL